MFFLNFSGYLFCRTFDFKSFDIKFTWISLLFSLCISFPIYGREYMQIDNSMSVNLSD